MAQTPGTKAGATLRWTGAMSLLLVALSSLGCQSTRPDKETQACKLTPGMTTAELANCDCFAANRNAQYAAGLSLETDRQGVQTVYMTTYFCPIGSSGIARVSVVNGIAREIYEPSRKSLSHPKTLRRSAH